MDTRSAKVTTKTLTRVVVVLAVVGSLAACAGFRSDGGLPVTAGTGIQSDAVRACGYKTAVGENSLNLTLCRTFELIEAYDDARGAWVRDNSLLNYGTVAAAIAAASAITLEWHSDILKSAGIAAGAITVLQETTSPAEKAQLLQNAIGDLACITRAIEATDAIGNNVLLETKNERDANKIASDAIATVASELAVKFQSLASKVSYGSIMRNISNFAAMDHTKETIRIQESLDNDSVGMFSLDGSGMTVKVVDLKLLSADVAACK